MIASVLERKPRKIVIDRLRSIDNEGDDILLTDQTEIEKEAIKTFSQTFKKRVHKFNDLSV